MPTNPLRHLPSVSELLENPKLKSMVDRVSRNVVVSSARSLLNDIRGEIRDATADMSIPSPGELAELIARRILQSQRPPLRPVVNATGILLHTGLGRAPLADAALAEMTAVARDYASVELDLETGKRSQRVAAVEGLLKQLTGAEAALVVNNNAAATLLTLAALAAGKEVIVSRGQLIEIGGSYRLPDVMTASGARLREVGTTNKTRLDDYQNAIGEETAALLRVHTSNYRVIGFTESVPLDELVRLGRRHNLPVIDDIGSGALIDFDRFGCEGEPQAAASVKTGADLVLFSGDKLLGGPQCGVIVGRRDLIARLAAHPLARALRVDKLTLAALAGTLRLYRDPEKAAAEIPLLQLLGTSAENLTNRAGRMAPQVAAADCVRDAQPQADVTFLGGGSAPAQQIPTCVVSVAPADMSVDALAKALRLGDPPIIARVQQDRLLIDLRSVAPGKTKISSPRFSALAKPKTRRRRKSPKRRRSQRIRRRAGHAEAGVSARKVSCEAATAGRKRPLGICHTPQRAIRRRKNPAVAASFSRVRSFVSRRRTRKRQTHIPSANGQTIIAFFQHARTHRCQNAELILHAFQSELATVHEPQSISQTPALPW